MTLLPVLSDPGKALCCLRRSDLQALFDSSAPVDLDAITGYRYRGVSMGLPAWVERLSWKKFAKTFERTPAGVVRGHNIRIEQDGLDLPWRASLRAGQEITFGPYQVTKVPGSDHIEIDYGLGTRGLSPLRLLRDPLRRLDEGSDLLLGASLVDVGLARRLPTPSWFLLERDKKL